VKAPAKCRLIGRWRIVESDLWDRAHLDLCGTATLTITTQGGEIAFGALEAGLEVEYARDSIGFHWTGCEKATRSRAKEPQNSSTTALSRSNSPTTTATKLSSGRCEPLLQQPARLVRFLRIYPIRWRSCAVHGQKSDHGEEMTQEGMDSSRPVTEVF
jgi:hypothetical protein